MSDHHFNPRADHNSDRWDWCVAHRQWEQRGNWRSCADQLAQEAADLSDFVCEGEESQ